MRKTKTIFSMLLVLVMAVATCVVPAFAAFSYTPVSGGTTTLYKDLVMDKDANVPNATFSFSIAPGTAVAGSAGTAPISAGVGSPTITSSVVFAPGDSTSNGTPSNASDADHKYARKTITADFSSVSFDEPGIYRYVITESGSNQGVTNDPNNTRYMDVYVTDNESNNTLVVSKYVLYTVENGTPTTKPDGFVNTYDSFDLTLSKNVSGNQASRDKYFKFVVTISDAVAGTVYNVDISNADATVASNTATLDAYEGESNPASLTVGAGGSVSGTFYLMHGQSIQIKGLATGTKYAITETPEDYSAAHVTNGGSSVSGAAIAATTIAADTTVAYTNTRSGTIPTGVALSAIPGILALMTSAVAAGAVSMKKKED